MAQSGSDPVIAGFVGSTPAPGNNDSADSSSETSKQTIGYYSTTINGATELDFLDWPATIAIDNLTITYHNTPETSSMMLLACGLAGLGLLVFAKRLATN